jgi:hypothetical protein
MKDFQYITPFLIQKTPINKNRNETTKYIKITL